MKVFYLSSHGFGHIIRTIPFILKQLRDSNESIYIACDMKQLNFLKAYFESYKSRIIYSEIVTDIGFINYEGSIEVNRLATIERVESFIISIDQFAQVEYDRLKDFRIKEVYVDISLIGIKVAQLLKVKSIMMTNFTWLKQYELLEFPKFILDYYKETESCVSELWLYPLAFPLEHIKCPRKQLDYQSRPLDEQKIKQLKEQYHQIVTIFTGMSATSHVKVINYTGLIIHSEHIEVDYDGPKLKLGHDVLDSHNYIAASDMIVTKSGWTTVSECIKSNTKMVLMERPSAYEDTYIIKQVKELGYGISIPEGMLEALDLSQLLRTIKEVKSCKTF